MSISLIKYAKVIHDPDPCSAQRGIETAQRGTGNWGTLDTSSWTPAVKSPPFSLRTRLEAVRWCINNHLHAVVLLVVLLADQPSCELLEPIPACNEVIPDLGNAVVTICQ